MRLIHSPVNLCLFLPVFHIALGLFALLQIHQMRTALVIRDNCTDYVVRPLLYRTCNFLTLFKDCGGPGTLWQTVKPLLIVAPSVIAGSWLLMIFFVKKLYEEFGCVFGSIYQECHSKSHLQLGHLPHCWSKPQNEE